MFFDEDDDDGFLNDQNIYHLVSRQLYALGSQHLEANLTMKNVPTHTEDGIPIRKLYVSNLPPKTTRAELFGVFAQYGFIKSCWLRMGDKGPNKSPTPTYAFVTYSNPADAYKAMLAPYHEKNLRGRNLRISPADSWHQPAQDADGRVRWKPHAPRPDLAEDIGTTSTAATDCTPGNPADNPADTSNPETELSNDASNTSEIEETYDILDILNRDCLNHVLAYVPILDLIRSERVSKRWQSMVQEYLSGIRTFKTSWWYARPAALTTAVLRRVLQRVGGSLTSLHIDHHWSALNDRTAHTVGKFCPNLEELKVVGMYTKNWNPLIYGCKQLKHLSFVSCNKLTDSSLVTLVKKESLIESLTVANNTHVTGLFLTGLGGMPPKLSSLAFNNCYSLQGTVLCAAMDVLPNLTSLKLDVCPVSMWKIIPQILKKLPSLRELSLSEYMSADSVAPQNNEFCESLTVLSELRVLNLSKNIYITNAMLKQVAQTCTKLESLNVSSCNSRKVFPGVSDEGVVAVCTACRALSRLDVSYLAGVTDAGLAAAARLPRLRALLSRGNPALSAAPVLTLISTCHLLREVDLCGCDGISEEVAAGAVVALTSRPRPLLLRLAGTAAATAQEIPTHKLLEVNIDEDLSDQHLRPDFVDTTFEDSSEDSFDEIYDHENIDMFFSLSDDDLFIDEDMDDYEGVYAYGLNGQDIILL